MNRRFGTCSIGLLIVSLAACAIVSCLASASTEDSPTNLPALLSQGTLDPALPSEFPRLKFSPDGNYILAQNGSSIFVLTRQPFAVHFQIQAPEAGPAQFTPDSSEVVFSRGTMRLSVERWNVASGEQTFEKEIVLVGGCVESRLSPDATTFACFSDHPFTRRSLMPYGCRRGIFNVFPSSCVPSYPGFAGMAPGSESNIDFELIDVKSGDIVTEKQGFIEWDVDNFPFLVQARKIGKLGISGVISIIPASFSPDGRYFAAGFRKHGIAVDLESRKLIPLGEGIERMLGGGFAFVSGEQVLAENQADPSKSEILSFPSGSVADTIPLGDQQIEGVTRGKYVVLRPIKAAPVGVLDWTSRTMTAAMPEPTGLDVWDGHLVAQLEDGELAITNIANSNVESKLALPAGEFRDLSVAAVSPDLSWLAVSNAGRGAAWELSNSQKRCLLHAFQGAYFDGDSALYADFPPLGDRPRSIGRADLSSFGLTYAHPVDEKTLETTQFERYLVSEIGAEKHGSKPALAVQDARDGRTLWIWRFPDETPRDFEISPDQNRLALLWMAEQKPAMDEIKKDKSLKTIYGKMKDHLNVILLQVLEAETGRAVGNVLVDAPLQASMGGDSQRIRVRVFGDWLFATLGDQTRIYSVSTGELRSTVPGLFATASLRAGLFVVREGDAALELRALADTDKRLRIDLPSPILFAKHSEDGKRLFVLTRDQKFFVFDAEALGHLVAGQGTQ